MRRHPLRLLPCVCLLITEFLKEDSPFCLTRAITRTMTGPCYTPLSLAPRDAPRRCGRIVCVWRRVYDLESESRPSTRPRGVGFGVWGFGIQGSKFRAEVWG